MYVSFYCMFPLFLIVSCIFLIFIILYYVYDFIINNITALMAIFVPRVILRTPKIIIIKLKLIYIKC